MADLDDIKDGKDFHTDKTTQTKFVRIKRLYALIGECSPDWRRIFNQDQKTVMLALDHGYFQADNRT